MNFIKNYFKGRTVAFYVAFGIAGFSLLTAIIYAGIFGGSEYMSWGAFVMLFLAFPVFIGLAFIRFGKFDFCKIASGVVAALNFASLVLVAVHVFPFIWQLGNQYAMDGTLDGGALLGGGIAVLVFLIICAITANVLAWLKMNKAPVEKEIPEENITVVGEEIAQ